MTAEEKPSALTIEDFKALSQGEELTLYSTNKECPSFVWIQDRVEGDLIWGAVRLPDGKQLPVQPYLFNAGDFAFTCYAPHLFSGGKVYISPTLPSQYPKRVDTSGYRPRPKITHSEQVAFKKLIERYEHIGFIPDFQGYSSPTEVVQEMPSGCLDFSLTKGPVVVRATIRTQIKRHLFAAKEWLVVIEDASHRDRKDISVSLGATAIIRRFGVRGIDEVIETVVSGIDQVYARSGLA